MTAAKSTSKALSPAASGTPALWREGVLALPEPFLLECGQKLSGARLAWQCAGPQQAPLIVVLGGISAHRSCCAQAGDRAWWPSQCGAGRALDTDRWRLLSIDWLGGCDGANCNGADGAAAENAEISTADQARALLLLLNRLGVRQVHLIVGASYGGAVAQHLAALLGERLRRLVLLCAAHRASQFALALRHVQRAILDLGGDVRGTLALARSLAVLGYRTPEGLEARFVGAQGADGVVAWLVHHGETFAARFDAAAYRRLGTALDGHSIDPAAIHAPTTLFGVREDLIVPPSLLREYATRAGEHCDVVEIGSPFGHDAFLKEDAAVAALLRAALENGR